jgi:hypothetical protein
MKLHVTKVSDYNIGCAKKYIKGTLLNSMYRKVVPTYNLQVGKYLFQIRLNEKIIEESVLNNIVLRSFLTCPTCLETRLSKEQYKEHMKTCLHTAEDYQNWLEKLATVGVKYINPDTKKVKIIKTGATGVDTPEIIAELYTTKDTHNKYHLTQDDIRGFAWLPTKKRK